MSRRSTHTLALFAILLIGFALRVHHLDADLTGDEGFSCSIVMDGPMQIVQHTLELREPHPVGYYFVLFAWRSLAGEGEFSSRLLGVLFGMLSIAGAHGLSVVLLRGPIGRRVGLVAAAFVALNAFMIAQSRDMRMYGMLLGLTVAMSAAFVFYVRAPTARRAAAYAVLAAAALHTQYYAAFVIGAHGLVAVLLALAGAMPRRALVTWAAAHVPVILVTLPWLWLVRDTLGGYVGFGVVPDVATAVETVTNAFVVGLGERSGRTPVIWLNVLGLALIVAGAIRVAMLGRRGRWVALGLVACLLTPVVATWLAAQTRPVFKDRYLIGAAMPLYVLAAAALAAHPRRRAWLAGYAVAAVVIAGMSVNTLAYVREPALADKHYAGLATTLKSASVDVDPARVRWAVNYPDYAFTCYLGTPDYLVLPPRAQDEAATDALVGQLREGATRRALLQLVGEPNWDGTGIAERSLASQFREIAELWTGRWKVKVFARAYAGDLRPVGVRFANRVLLDRALVSVNTAAGFVELHLDWDVAAARLTASEKLFVHVMSAADPTRLVAQLDVPLDAGSELEPLASYGVRLPDGLAPGNYRVYLGLYDPALPGMPRIATADGADRFEIAAFEVPPAR